MERYDDALEQYQATVKLFPQNPIALCGLAETYRSMERYDKALDQYQATVKLFPQDVFALCGLASVLSDTKQYQQAIEQTEITLQRSPRNWIALHIQAMCLMHLHRYEEAKALFLRGSEEAPPANRSYFRSGLALVEFRLGQRAEACSTIRSVQATANQPGIQLVRIGLECLQDEAEAARSLFENLSPKLNKFERETRQEIDGRYYAKTGATHDDEWFFEHLCHCLQIAL